MKMTMGGLQTRSFLRFLRYYGQSIYVGGCPAGGAACSGLEGLMTANVSASTLAEFVDVVSPKLVLDRGQPPLDGKVS